MSGFIVPPVFVVLRPPLFCHRPRKRATQYSQAYKADT
jgi:hypothetical protein